MPDNDYTSGLNILLGDLASSRQIQPQSPEQDVQDIYESTMDEGTPSFDQLIQNSSTVPAENEALDRYALGQAASGMAADEYSKLDELQYGRAPEQQIVDPAAMIGSAGQRAERGLRLGRFSCWYRRYY